MRVGFLGGSFDPIHIGHLWIAGFAREQIGLDRILIVPAGSPPHKSRTVAPFEYRLDLVRRAVAPFPTFEASDLERDATRPSYTIDSLRTLRASLDPSDEIWLLMGADSLGDLPLWHRPEEILRLACLGIYGREGHAENLPLGARARPIEGPACGLSSTLIRERLGRGLGVRGLVPAEIVSDLEGPSPYGDGVRR